MLDVHIERLLNSSSSASLCIETIVRIYIGGESYGEEKKSKEEEQAIDTCAGIVASSSSPQGNLNGKS